MKTLLRLEEGLLFAGGSYLFSLLPYAWWWFPALILLPDLGMLGYLAGPKAGSWTYNFFHHRGLGFTIGLLGLYLGNPLWQAAGIILFSHTAMDRIFGYGLKYEKGFIFTHLGTIGPKPVSHA